MHNSLIGCSWDIRVMFWESQSPAFQFQLVLGLHADCQHAVNFFHLMWVLLLLLLLLLLSHFSRVWLCATPYTAAHQASLSLGFSRQEHWSGLPFPSPMHESEKWKWSRLVLSNSSQPHGLQPTRLLHPWDFPGKSTRVGCHCLLWCGCLYLQNNSRTWLRILSIALRRK